MLTGPGAPEEESMGSTPTQLVISRRGIVKLVAARLEVYVEAMALEVRPRQRAEPLVVFDVEDADAVCGGGEVHSSVWRLGSG